MPLDYSFEEDGDEKGAVEIGVTLNSSSPKGAVLQAI